MFEVVQEPDLADLLVFARAGNRSDLRFMAQEILDLVPKPPAGSRAPSSLLHHPLIG